MATVSKLNDWSLNTNMLGDRYSAFRAPECCYLQIIGHCEKRGKVVVTSDIEALDENEPHVVTMSGSLYVLGESRRPGALESIKVALARLGRS